MLENWYEVLKKVMRMWSSGTILTDQMKATKTAHGSQKDVAGGQSSEGNKGHEDADDFYVFLYDEEDRTQTQTTIKKGSGRGRGYDRHAPTQRVLGFWCFNAGVGFKQIQSLAPRSIILTSGTLSPLPSFEAELQITFPQKLENPHVISPDQVHISIMKRSVNDCDFNFNYQNKDNMEMLDELGKTVARVSKHVPGGLLMFFPSYRLMNDVYERWEQSNVLHELEQIKTVYKEPKKATEYQYVMDQYYSSIFEPDPQQIQNGAILMGVCRGRISEGLDFSDKAARCVIIVGIPFPQMTDPKVILKKEYLD